MRGERRAPGRVVLVGLMGAGKSTVGRLLAERLGYRFCDLDEEVERAAGRPIADIFRDAGEEAFRRLEAEATARLDGRTGLVIAAGGGWMARPELRDRWPDAVRVWLQVSPEMAVSRLAGALESRPLLDPHDPVGSARALLARRAAAYGRAELRVDTDGRSAVDVAGRILALLEGPGRGTAAGEGPPASTM